MRDRHDDASVVGSGVVRGEEYDRAVSGRYCADDDDCGGPFENGRQ